MRLVLLNVREPSKGKRPALPVTLAGLLLLFGGAIHAQLDAYRTIDGRDNNLKHPRWGSTGIELLRVLPAAYADGRSEPAGEKRPGPREISNACAAQSESVPNEYGLTDFFWAWAQFLDHDISLSGPAQPAEAFDIPVPAGDPHFDPLGTGTATIPFSRTLYGKRAERQQLNEITAWIDASHVYGSDETRARALRRNRGRGDRLKKSRDGLLPYNTRGLPNAPSDHDPSLFLAGDVRANENVALTSLHTLFVREHNRIVRHLRRQGGLSKEERYQLARALVGAEMQAITYNEFLPLLLGPKALATDSGYRPNINPGISNVFSTACYRFGHSMLPPELMRLRPNGNVMNAGNLPLRDAFFAPRELSRYGVEPYLRGLATQSAQRVDGFIVDDVRNFLFGQPRRGGFDLAALNIQRGRDHGLPGYNRARAALGLERAKSFADITTDPLAQQRLADIYPSVKHIDAWVGALAEDHVPGAMVGELAFHVLRDQFERLRDGDRFWYRRALPDDLVEWVEEHNLARIIRLNTEIGSELPDDVFRSGS